MSWPVIPLGELTLNHDGKRRPVKESERKPGPYPYYGASGVVDHVDDYLIDGEYLLIAEDGENLRTRQTPIAFMALGKSWVNNHAHIVTGNDRANTRYLMYALSSADIAPYLTGAVMPKLTQANLNRIPIPCPPIEEQTRIAEVLGALDDKIELNRRINETLEAIVQALFQSWFVDFDPVRAKVSGEAPESIFQRLGLTTELLALFPDRLVDSELGEIPEGWRWGEIGEQVGVLGGGTPSTKTPEYWDKGHIFWATPRDLSGVAEKVIRRTARKITEEGLASITSELLPEGTVLLSSRAPVGYLALTKTPMAINQGFIAMKCDGRLSGEFALQWAVHRMSEIQQRASGTTFQEISKRNFRTIPVLVPDANTAAAFTACAKRLYDAISENVATSESLSETRDSLLPRLISGELTVEGNTDE
jgi:type I restriction enzyme S subunit